MVDHLGMVLQHLLEFCLPSSLTAVLKLQS